MQTKKKSKSAESATPDLLETIKKTTIISLFSDDDLLDILVLKGGNAMDIAHRVSSRASVDIDLSMSKDFDASFVWPKIEASIRKGFADKDYLAFDIKMTPRPGKKLPEELASFWGGYLVEFKLISLTRAAEIEHDQNMMRREALMINQVSTFTIDISRYEYIDEKQSYDLDGYAIYVYSPEMIVCEKLRAICQQMPEYGEIIKRSAKGKQRARDFIDIEVLIKTYDIDLSSEKIKHLVEQIFSIKKAPLTLLGKILETKNFHELGYREVSAAMKPGIKVQPFDYYFDFVIEQIQKLKPLWDI